VFWVIGGGFLNDGKSAFGGFLELGGCVRFRGASKKSNTQCRQNAQDSNHGSLRSDGIRLPEYDRTGKDLQVPTGRLDGAHGPAVARELIRRINIYIKMLCLIRAVAQIPDLCRDVTRLEQFRA